MTICDTATSELWIAAGEPATAGAAGEIVENLICPAGRVESSKGKFIMDAEAWRSVQAAFNAGTVRPPVDYEHQTLGGDYAAPDGKAPAAGWIETLRFDPARGLIAGVRWTDKAREYIRAGEYRYPSPVVRLRPDDRRVIALHSVALTNKPAIVRRWEALAAKEAPNTGKETKAMQNDLGTNGETVADPSATLARVAEVLGIKEIAEPGDLLRAILEAVRKLKDTEREAEQVASSMRLEPSDEARPLLTKLAGILVQRGTELPKKPSTADVIKALIDMLEGDADKKTADGAEEDAGDGEAKAIAASVRQGLGLAPDAGLEAVNVAMRESLSGDAAEALAAMKEQLAAKGRDDFLRPFIDKGVVDPVSKDRREDYDMVLRVYAMNPTDCRMMLNHRVASLPPPGRIVNPEPGDGLGRASNTRGALIDQALVAFKADPDLQRGTSAVAHVNLALRDAGLERLTDDERMNYAVNAVVQKLG